MNNIIIDSSVNYNKGGVYKLTIDKDIDIKIESDSLVKLYLNTLKNVNININAESNVKIYNLTSKGVVVNLKILDEIEVNLYNMSITDKKIVNMLNIYHKAKNSVSHLYCYGVSYNEGNIKIAANSYINKGMTGVNCNQVSRTININNGTSVIEPNLYVDEFDSVANHSAYTGPFDDKYLFYLETKGISRDKAFNLLLKGFMKLDDLPKDFEKLLDKKIKNVIGR